MCTPTSYTPVRQEKTKLNVYQAIFFKHNAKRWLYNFYFELMPIKLFSGDVHKKILSDCARTSHQHEQENGSKTELTIHIVCTIFQIKYLKCNKYFFMQQN